LHGDSGSLLESFDGAGLGACGVAVVGLAVGLYDVGGFDSRLLYTILAALYGATMTVAMTTPPDENILLELTDVRRQAPLWCASVVLLSFLLAYFCGHAAWRWRRMFELAHA
jgi:hypothetical protein